MTTATASLAEITRAEADAHAAATKAAHAAEVARQKADAARERAEQERQDANHRFLAVLEQEHEAARTVAVTTLGEARESLTVAVKTAGDVFANYISYVKANVAVWQIESGLAEQRSYLGKPTRETTPPSFSFVHDIAAVIDNVSYDAMDSAIQANRDRKASYLAGREVK
jgi:hypothetical protein